MTSYAFLDHTADLGIRVSGKTKKVVFQKAGLALFDLLISKKSRNKGFQKTLRVSGIDVVDLWVNWLRALLDLWTSQGRVVTNITLLSLEESALSASLEMETFNPNEDEINHEIKAVTYHRAEVNPTPKGWEGTVIFDL